ncbi:MAG: transposase [Sulfitobacter sp.]
MPHELLEIGWMVSGSAVKRSRRNTNQKPSMNHIEIIQQLGQDDNKEVSNVFDTFIRGTIRSSFIDIMASEVSALCGAAYDRSVKGACRRAGSAPSALEIEGEPIRRPRVRRQQDDGSESEVDLDTYQAAKGLQTEQIREAIIKAYQSGTPSREVQESIEWNKGASSTEVSRVWAKEGAKRLLELENRRFDDQRWAGIMLDGIRLSKDLTAVVALGITDDGKKVILGLEIGCSENEEVCKDLVKKIREKGFGPVKGHRLLALIDGSKALKNAVLGAWPDAVIQRCLVHKERNIRAKLSNKHHGTLATLFKALRISQGEDEAKEALEKLRSFLEKKSAQSLASLEEADGEMIAFFELNVPNSLNISFLSTNSIENAFLNTRRKINRVTRWRENTKHASNWLAYALLTAEKGFNRVRGCSEMPLLMEALKAPLKA